ncbi:hypothetical protein TBLA_0B02720 [Henningerozyma blattae CBS 6284]|uniref:Glucose N-acetyltransferase 1 n=1 Tax=Henningerozyma blattae (strain ATCC 34711 / CBS 6284 / DSM 70876 / NBRC 10599 / NRRL Y-10934 / UCD 77-7) TaxID=1071380 RepID=I2GYB2_HENB6|nr:hypothetical protein TBLA_0B02720 [Tetrapisispora blattae CBS 6284]CCH59114.1 hypothetical protein TBLA_0B02720 [Tetrapisispora blattae CBS 6284]
MVRIISKRKLRWLGIIIMIFVLASISVRIVVQFQFNKEIDYYKKFFKQNKDGLSGIYNPLELKQIPEETIDDLYLHELENHIKDIDWNKYAYVTYITDPDYLCNALVLFNSLIKSETFAKLVLLVSGSLFDPEITPPEQIDDINFLLDKLSNMQTFADDQIIIKKVNTIKKVNDDTPWNDSLTKLHIFNQTEFERIIYLDNDAILNHENENLDELFFLPTYITFAAPLTYWFTSIQDVEKSSKVLKKKSKVNINLNYYIKTLKTRIKKGQMIYNHLPSLPDTLYLNAKNLGQDIISSGPLYSPIFDYGTESVGNLKFATDLMVIKPDQAFFDEFMYYELPKILKSNEKYDMDLINGSLFNLKRIIYNQFQLFRKLRKHFVPNVLILPFNRYNLLSGSVKKNDELKILNNDILGYKRLSDSGEEVLFDIEDIVANSKYIHFSDYPLGKPWNYESIDKIKCDVDNDFDFDEADNENNYESNKKICELWNSIYQKYYDRREICFS